MLNLLPPSEKKVLVQEKQKRLFLVLCFELLVFLCCIILVFLSIEFYGLGEVVSQDFALEQVKNESQSNEFLHFENLMQEYNQKLILVDSFYKSQKFMGGALNTITSIQKPSQLYFTRISFQPKNQSKNIEVTIAGYSNTRDSLIVFRNNIEANEKTRNVNFSPESWVRQKDINFNVTLDVINGK